MTFVLASVPGIFLLVALDGLACRSKRVRIASWCLSSLKMQKHFGYGPVVLFRQRVPFNPFPGDLSSLTLALQTLTASDLQILAIFESFRVLICILAFCARLSSCFVFGLLRTLSCFSSKVAILDLKTEEVFHLGSGPKLPAPFHVESFPSF